MDHDNILANKLGYKPDQSAYILHSLKGYYLYPSNPKLIDDIKELSNKCVWIQAFYKDREQLEIEIDKLKENLSTTGQLWISWPKKSSGVESDLSDQIVRNLGLSIGLVDIKVASIDDTWSGLKFVYRTNDR